MLWATTLFAVAIAAQPRAAARPMAAGPGAHKAALGIFAGSDERGVSRLPAFEQWLGREVTVGRTYLPGETWASFMGPDFILKPWTKWRAEKPGRVLAINVPMVAPNEGGLSDSSVAVLLNAGSSGAFDLIYHELARRLVADGAGDSIIVLGWEMNGSTYSSRCSPDPAAWKGYWRRIVTAMRSIPGQHFRFDFTVNRGRDAIAWTDCYPGDDVVDILGMDNYDQPPADGFRSYVSQPYGLQYHADFAQRHGKPLSFPEWGLFKYGDRPEFVTRMLDWISSHDVVYHSLSDYCPHGVWQCSANPRSSEGFRTTLRRMLPSGTPVNVPTPTASAPTPSVSVPTPSISVPTPSVKAPVIHVPSPSVELPTPSLQIPTPSVELPRAVQSESPAVRATPTPTPTPTATPMTVSPTPTSTGKRAATASPSPHPVRGRIKIPAPLVRAQAAEAPPAEAPLAQTPSAETPPVRAEDPVLTWFTGFVQGLLTFIDPPEPTVPVLPSPAVMPPATPAARGQ